MYNLLTFLIIYAAGFITIAIADTLHDPTQPPGTTSLQTFTGGELQIEAIFFNKDSNNSFVIIEGNRFTIGDEVMGATIIKIDPYAIKLKDDNGEFTVTIPYSQIKTLTTTKNKKKK